MRARASSCLPTGHHTYASAEQGRVSGRARALVRRDARRRGHANGCVARQDGGDKASDSKGRRGAFGPCCGTLSVPQRVVEVIKRSVAEADVLPGGGQKADAGRADQTEDARSAVVASLARRRGSAPVRHLRRATAAPLLCRSRASSLTATCEQEGATSLGGASAKRGRREEAAARGE